MKPASLILQGILTLACLSAQAGDCPGSKVGGVVARIEASDRPPVPQSPRAPSTAVPRQGDYLCAGERLFNPRGSGVIVHADLAGGIKKELKPGDSIPISPPTFRTYITDAEKRFDDSFPKVFGLEVRGEKRKEIAFPSHVHAVDAWGPLVIYQPAGTKGAMTLSVNNELVQANARDFVSIDLGSRCGKRCSVVVDVEDGARLAFQVILSDERDAPRPDWLQRLDGVPENRALLGAWLAYALNDERWLVQGMSLMLSGSCALPATLRRLKPFYPDVSMDAVCRIR